MRANGLLAWQYEGYPAAHRARANLLIHILTMPLFAGGFIAVVSSPFAGGWRVALAGVGAMVVTMVLQGRGHAGEANPPAPFRGPLDVAARIFAEQLVTFPRFVLSGGFARAWHAARRV